MSPLTIWTWKRWRALEEALINFPGCAVVISHDRWFLDRIATHILAFEGDSQVTWFAGNFAEYEADRNAASEMTRINPTGSNTSPFSAKQEFQVIFQQVNLTR